MRRFRGLIVAVSLSGLCMGCSGLFGRAIEQEYPTPTPIPTPIIPVEPTYTVQRGEVVRELEFLGRISPVEEHSLYFRRDGYVSQVVVRQGDEVNAGDLLAELDIDDLMRQTAQAEVTLSTAQLRLQGAQSTLEHQIADAKLAVETAEVQLDQLKRQPDATQVELLRLAWDKAKNNLWSAQAERDALMGRADAPDYQRNQAQAAVANAEIAVREAQLRYELGAKPSATAAEIRLQEIKVVQAKQKLAWLQEGVDQVLVNEVDQAKLALERLRAQVADSQILAPISGRILSVSIYAGHQVKGFQTAIVVADPSAIEASATLISSQLQDLVEGQVGTASLSSYPGETWQCTVRRLPYPYGSGGSDRPSVDADQTARIRIEGDIEKLELGDLARVVIVIERKADVLWLPPEALRNFQGRNFVILQDADRQRRVDVTVGLQGKERYEILDGLQEGQLVIGQ